MASEAHAATDVLAKLEQASYPVRNGILDVLKPASTTDRVVTLLVAAALAAGVCLVAGWVLWVWATPFTPEEGQEEPTEEELAAGERRLALYAGVAWLVLTGLAALGVFTAPTYPAPPEPEAVTTAVKQDLHREYRVSHVTPSEGSSREHLFVRKLWKTRTGNVVPAPTVKVQLEDHSVATYKVYLEKGHVKLARQRGLSRSVPAPASLRR